MRREAFKDSRNKTFSEIREKKLKLLKREAKLVQKFIFIIQFRIVKKH